VELAEVGGGADEAGGPFHGVAREDVDRAPEVDELGAAWGAPEAGEEAEAEEPVERGAEAFVYDEGVGFEAVGGQVYFDAHGGLAWGDWDMFALALDGAPVGGDGGGRGFGFGFGFDESVEHGAGFGAVFDGHAEPGELEEELWVVGVVGEQGLGEAHAGDGVQALLFDMEQAAGEPAVGGVLEDQGPELLGGEVPEAGGMVDVRFAQGVDEGFCQVVPAGGLGFA